MSRRPGRARQGHRLVSDRDRPAPAARRPGRRPSQPARPRGRREPGRRGAGGRRAAPGRPRRVRAAARRAEGAGQAGRAAQGEEQARPAGPRQASWPSRVKALQAEADAAGDELDALVAPIDNVVEPGVAARRRGRLRRAPRGRRRRATSRPRASSRATTSSSASGSARSTPSAAPRSPARASTSSPASARGWSSRCSTWRWTQAVAAGFTPMITPTLVKPEIMARHRVPRRARGRDLPPRRPTTCTWSAPRRWRSPGTTRTRSST